MNAAKKSSVEVPPEALLDPDPDLRLVWADMSAYAEAHPCECHALCTCDEPYADIPGAGQRGC